MQHGLIWVGTGVQASNKKSAQCNDLNYVGSYAGAMATTPSDASAEEVLSGDMETARLFGQRVTEITKQFVAGRA